MVGGGGGVCFFFQAEDGIRDRLVTGVQTCALPICVQAQGDHSLTWNAQEQASGMYLVRAETAGSVAVQKILLLK